MASVQEQLASTILIIDDALENRLLLASQLRRENYRILSAGTGPEGLRIAREELPDLILLDVMLPGMSGFEVCKTLKNDELTANIPIIIITSLRDVTYRIQGIESGADEFLSRPHHREELLVRVKSLVQLKRARERLEHERNHLQLLYDVAQSTTRHIDLTKTITDVIDYTQRAVGATKGSVILTDPDGNVTHKFLARAISGISVGDSIAHKVMHEGFAGWLWHNRAGSIVKDTSDDERWVPLPDDPEPAGSAVGVPLINATDEVLGLIILTHPQNNYFRDTHLAVLTTIGGQVSAALRNARLFDKVKEERSKLEAILSQSNDAIVTTDEEQRIALFNHAAEAIFGIPANRVIGRCVEDVPELLSLTDLFAAAGVGPVGTDIVLNENSILYASVSPVAGAGYIAVLQDVTERIKMERREKEELRELFARYVSPTMLDHVIANDTNIFERRKRWAVVLFADLRNNTEMIVNLAADEALNLLNEIFDELMDVIYEYDGTILDVIGDELEVGFNVPLDQPDAARRALLTAIEMQRRFDARRPEWIARAGAPLGLGIGIDQGEVVIGNVGSRRRANLALVGEAVNTAHRLVDLADDGHIVISSSLHKLVEQDAQTKGVKFNSIGMLRLKGKPTSAEVFRANLRPALQPVLEQLHLRKASRRV